MNSGALGLVFTLLVQTRSSYSLLSGVQTCAPNTYATLPPLERSGHGQLQFMMLSAKTVRWTREFSQIVMGIWEWGNQEDLKIRVPEWNQER